MAKGDDIEERLVDFAVRVIKLCSHLPKTDAGVHISKQLLRSGTAPAAHYAEARSAESKNDFVHKLKICIKELNESRVWLKIVVRSKMLSESKLKLVIQENDELCRIIGTSIRTARSKSK